MIYEIGKYPNAKMCEQKMCGHYTLLGTSILRKVISDFMSNSRFINYAAKNRMTTSCYTSWSWYF